MKRIFQTILKPGQQLDEKLLEQKDKDFIEDFINNAHIFGFDGEKCTWKETEEMLLITFVEKQDIEKIIEIEVNGGEIPAEFVDITKDIINGKYDTSILGYAEEKMIIEFHQYKEDFIGSDEILDKINEVGIESLTENDKTNIYDMKYLKSYEKIFESLQDSDVTIDQLLESIGIPEQRRPEIVSWWNDNRDHIKIKFFDFNTTHPICGVFLGEDVIAVNRRLRMPMPPHFRLFIMLHESRHCDQYREGRFIDGYFDSVVNGDRETFMKAYRELEKDANDFAIDSMREIGFTREMDSEEYRLRGNEGAGNQVYAMMTKDINDMKPTDFFDLLRKQIGIK